MAFVFSGKKIKQLRMGLSLSIVKMARICGISRQTIYEIEEENVKDKRTPSVKILEKIMAQFPVKPDYFFVRTNAAKEDIMASKGTIYFIQDDMGRVKIGATKSIGKRLEAYTYMNLPFEPKVVHSFETIDRHRAEVLIHERFADKKIRGEWFNLDQNDLKFVKSGNLKKTIKSMIE